MRLSVIALLLFTIVTQGYSKTVYVNHQATGNNSGNSWANAYTSLAEALSKAVSGTDIWVAAGIYYPGSSASDVFALKNGVSLLGGFSGSETSSQARNPLSNRTILSGNIGDPDAVTDNSSLIIKANKLTTQVLVSGFVIEAGYSTGFFASGILIESCSPYFEYCTIANNIANGSYSSGGGVTITGFDATAAPIFSNCIFKGNQCSVIGGAVHSNNTTNRPRFVGCLFDGNTADRGAAIHNGGGVVVVINCTIVNNTAEKGSATYTTSGNQTAVVNTIVWGNKSTTSTGFLENSTGSATTQVTYSIVEKGFSGTGNLSANPGFVSAGNYQITKTSSAFNSADPKTGDYGLPGMDLGMAPRRTFRKFDRGAYEYQCLESDATAASLSVTQCTAYTSPSGKVLNKTGVYTDVIANYNGCDSLITIQLQINSSDTILEATACQAYRLNGKEYTQSGNYSQVLPNKKGCDSTIQLKLEVTRVETGVTVDNNVLTAKAQGAQYAWMDCDANKPIAGADAKTFTADKKGRYAVIVTVGGCSDTSECFLVEPLSMAKGGMPTWQVYPNPSNTGFIIIETEWVSPTQGELFTILGERILHFEVEGTSTKLELGNLPKGRYFLRLGGRMAPVQID